MSCVLVPLEKLDVNKLTFGKVKEKRYKGKDVPLYYMFENKPLPLYLSKKVVLSCLELIKIPN